MNDMVWHKGEPDIDGYYLVAWKANRAHPNVTSHVVVSELWYNPDAIHHWWFTRGYTGQPKYGGMGDAMTREVVGWMPMPAPPKD
jgi:hypothetical protein